MNTRADWGGGGLDEVVAGGVEGSSREDGSASSWGSTYEH